MLVIERQGTIDIRYQLPFIIMVAIHLMIFGITFILFAKNGFKSVNPETRLKAKFALGFITLFLTGAILDSFAKGAEIALVARICLISGSLSIYLVFAMPNWLKKRINIE